MSDIEETAARFGTKDVAAAVGVHPNTVRLYEAWGYLPLIPRESNGYRRYSQAHLDQMILARAALPGPFPGGGSQVYELVRQAANGRFENALKLANAYLETVRRERIAAEEAADLAESWAKGRVVEMGATSLLRGEVAKALDVTMETLRNWERNGLVTIERDEAGRRVYCEEDLKRLKVIRMLRKAGYGLMSILRMLDALDSGDKRNLRSALNTPREVDDVRHASDQWLTTLEEHEQRAKTIIRHLQEIIG